MLKKMRPGVSTACIITALVFSNALAEPADTLPWNIPEHLRPAIERPSFKAAFDVGSWLNPFYLRGDFDGDGTPDYALLVIHLSDGKKGIVIWLSTRPNSGPTIFGAGTKSRTGGGDYDDWGFFDAWQVYGKRTVIQGVGEGKPPKLTGEAILIERSEAASGLLYWDGKQFRWYQQGD
jgi:hypothetical protein